MVDNKNIDNLSITTIRSLCIDGINKANSGHPGMALGSAPILYTLWTKHLIANPDDPTWINRDRFVLSAGHASMLLYTMLHLSGYQVTMDDLKSFRQLGSKTPGHPEFGHTIGVDATAGPLAQGIAQAVGMAMAEQALAAQYIEGNKLVDHFTYVLCGDGCLEEGLSQEAISLAGHQKLNKLILFYDANKVTLDGGLDLSFSENVKGRFEASEWNVIEILDGNDINTIDKAIIEAKKSKDKPTLIMVHTIIGFGSSKQGTSKVHGSPLGMEDGKKTKVEVYGFDHEDFYVPTEVYENFKNTFIKRGHKAYENYNKTLDEYKKKNSVELDKFLSLKDWDVTKYLPEEIPELVKGSSESTRNASGKALNAYMLSIPNLMGGSADVAGSVMTKLNGGTNFEPTTRYGHNINWGIREFGMACAQNGMLLHGGVRTYVGCFLVFADYMKSAIRTACLSKLPAIYLFSHDSIAVGEDGPTHQPIEHLAMLRSLPNINVIRPCDERETYTAWKIALKSKHTPSALALSRQNLPLLDGSSDEGASKGGYIISKEHKNAVIDVIATGSEVSLAVAAQKKLLEEGIDVRVISMPCIEIFDSQSEAYKNEVLHLPYEKRVSIEMLSTFGWARLAKFNMGIDTFGTSAPAKAAIEHFGFTVDKAVEFIKKAI
ncbi:MAG: transketolase [Erysipelotrichaceae bacterium]|nr:transketolase [Erysipelotrichaceae bacterium]